LIQIWESAGGSFTTGYRQAIENRSFQALANYSDEHLRRCASDASSFREWFSIAQRTVSAEEEAQIRARQLAVERRDWGDIKETFESDYFRSRQKFDEVRTERGLREEDFQNKVAEFVASWAKRRGIHLDQQQARAAGALEKNVLVTARAGSGKTRTIEARAAFLHQHCQVDPDEILILAFNKKAAIELATRIEDHFQSDQPHIMTFDALANALTQRPETRLYDNQENDEREQSRLIQDLVDEFIQSSEFSPVIRSLMLEYFKSDWHQIITTGRFLGPEAQLRFRESLPNYSLDLSPKKSFGEKQIANFLIRNGVKFDYEKHWTWWQKVSYKPDFTIPTPQGQREALVIEYFGMEGDPDYDRQTTQKTHFWGSQTTAEFLAFFPRDIVNQNSMEQRLSDELARVEVEFRPLSDEELWEKYKSRQIDVFSQLLTQCITLCRNANWDSSELIERIRSHQHPSKPETEFLGLLPALLARYERALNEQERLDFPGVFWDAIESVRSGNTEFVRQRGEEVGDLSRIRFVLVDEFQDLSERFAQLLQQIRHSNEDVCFFCVGDDWQAINGFAGSDLKYFQRFDSVFGSCTKINLTTNYRSYKKLVAFGNGVMADKGSPARPHHDQEGTVNWANWENFSISDFEREELGNWASSKFFSALTRSISALLRSCETVTVLFHFNRPPYSLPNLRGSGLKRHQERVRDLLPEVHRPHVEFSTVHSYKGKEADGVILCDDSPKVFPFIHQLWIFQRIFGKDLQRLIDEEHRLYYVAVSRAKKHLLLLRQQESPSLFHPLECPGVSQLVLEDLPECEGVLRTDKTQIVVANGFSGATRRIRDVLKNNCGYRWSQHSQTWSKLLTPAEVRGRSWERERWYHPGCTVEHDGQVITVRYRPRDT
jgi:DNA helicase-4